MSITGYIPTIRTPWGETFNDVAVELPGTYENGRRAVRLRCDDGDILATLSLNLPDEEVNDADGWFFSKDYSEGAGWVELLVGLGVLEDSGQVVPVGPYAGSTASIVRLTPSFC